MNVWSKHHESLHLVLSCRKSFDNIPHAVLKSKVKVGRKSHGNTNRKWWYKWNTIPFVQVDDISAAFISKRCKNHAQGDLYSEGLCCSNLNTASTFYCCCMEFGEMLLEFNRIVWKDESIS